MWFKKVMGIIHSTKSRPYKKMRSRIFYSFLFLIMSLSPAFSKKIELLVFDKDESKNELPRNFRDLSGLGLNVIASGQFSEKELVAIRQKYPNEKILVVDLRRESHGFINGQAVSWRSPFDQSNIGEKIEKILRDEKSRLNLLKKDEEIIVNKILEKDEKNGWYEEVEPKIIAVAEISTEENLVKKFGFEYKRFAVRDHASPDHNQVLEFEKFIKNLPLDKKIYIHCAAGRGRTTTFLTLYDIMNNGDKMSLEEILIRQAKVGGVRLDEISEDEKWRENLAQERLKMIREFYQNH